MGGEAKLKKSATQKLIAEHPHCCFCAGARPTATREHMPPKSLFDGSHRPDRLVVPACKECNGGTSTADLTLAIISRWGEAPRDAENRDYNRLVSRVKKQAPELPREWTGNFGALLNRNGRRHLRAHGVDVPDHAPIVTVGPLSVRQLNLFAHKATLALYFEHSRSPLLSDGAFFATWRTKEDYAAAGLPQGLLELLPRYGTLVQGEWDVGATFEYRYELSNGVFGAVARLRKLWIYGFAVTDARVLPNRDGWITPGDLLHTIQAAEFERRR